MAHGRRMGRPRGAEHPHPRGRRRRRRARRGLPRVATARVRRADPMGPPDVTLPARGRAGPRGRAPPGPGRGRARTHARRRAARLFRPLAGTVHGSVLRPAPALVAERGRGAAAPVREAARLPRALEPGGAAARSRACVAHAASRVPAMKARWDALWFVPEPPSALAAARIVFALQALWILLSRDIPALSALPQAFWADVGASARWRYLIFEGHPGLERALQALAMAALVGALLGVHARACCALAGLLL